jgi:hypothetical protein
MTDIVSSTIRELAQDRKLIPFIGAGFSIPLGLPAWSELIRRLAVQLDWDPDVFMQSGNNNYLQLAEYYVLKKSIGELRYELSKGLQIDINKLKSSEAHKLLTEISTKAIYTTNYDEGIENAFELYKKKFSVIRNINDLKNAKENATLIYKFHGDFINDDSLVLTETSYFDRMQFEAPLDIRLRSDILDNTLLFLGYSLSDINIRTIFYKLSKINKELKSDCENYTAVLVTFGISEIQKEILSRKWNVQVVELDPKDKQKSLLDFLEKIYK